MWTRGPVESVVEGRDDVDDGTRRTTDVHRVVSARNRRTY